MWEGKEGDTLEGFYIGSRPIKFRKNVFLTHMIQDEETGEVLSFSGAIADRKMARIPKGSYVWVTMLAKVRTGNGDAKDFTIETEEGVRLLDENAGQEN